MSYKTHKVIDCNGEVVYVGTERQCQTFYGNEPESYIVRMNIDEQEEANGL